MSLLSDIAENEKLLGDLYSIYKGRFHNNRFLWSRLVHDEGIHADIFNQLHTDDNILKAILRNVNKKSLVETKILILKELEQAANVSLKTALEQAIKLEQAILNAKYLSALEHVKSLPSEDFLEIRFDINEHIKMLRGAFSDTSEKSPTKAS